MLKSREEFWEFVNKQFDYETPASLNKVDTTSRWHYGRVELKELADEMFGLYGDTEDAATEE